MRRVAKRRCVASAEAIASGAESEGRERETARQGAERRGSVLDRSRQSATQRRGGENRQHRARIGAIAARHAPTFGSRRDVGKTGAPQTALGCGIRAPPLIAEVAGRVAAQVAARVSRGAAGGPAAQSRHRQVWARLAALTTTPPRSTAAASSRPTISPGARRSPAGSAAGVEAASRAVSSAAPPSHASLRLCGPRNAGRRSARVAVAPQESPPAATGSCARPRAHGEDCSPSSCADQADAEAAAVCRGRAGGRDASARPSRRERRPGCPSRLEDPGDVGEAAWEHGGTTSTRRARRRNAPSGGASPPACRAADRRARAR